MLPQRAVQVKYRVFGNRVHLHQLPLHQVHLLKALIGQVPLHRTFRLGTPIHFGLQLISFLIYVPVELVSYTKRLALQPPRHTPHNSFTYRPFNLNMNRVTTGQNGLLYRPCYGYCYSNNGY